MPYAKNLPDCDFSSEGILECEPDRCKIPVAVLHVNVQGLQSAYNEPNFLLSSSPKGIVAICEMFLSSSSPMSMFEVPMMKSVSRNGKLNARGIQVICIHQDWSFNVKEEISGEEGLCETLFVEINPTSGDSFIFVSVYSPPSSNPKSFFEVFESALLKFGKSNKPVIISGDFNFDLLHLDLSTHKEFLNIILCAGFLPRASLPTGVANTAATLIDNIFFFC